MPEAPRVDLVRHGETTAGPVFLGRSDPPLSEAGRAQTEAAVADLATWGGASWDAVVSSPRRRCLQPAQQLARARDLPLQVEAGLAELDFGDWDGKRAEVVQCEAAAALEAFWQDPWHNAPPGGERLAHFARRVSEAWERLLRHPPGRRILVFTHGGVLRLILLRLLSLPREGLWRLACPHGARLRIQAPVTLVRYEGLAP